MLVIRIGLVMLQGARHVHISSLNKAAEDSNIEIKIIQLRKSSDLLTEEELFIQKTANEFVTKEFKPLINEHFEKGTFPIEIATKLGELGFMGSALPEESGGAGVSNVAVSYTHLTLPTKA